MSGGNGTSLHPAWMRGITITFYATIGLMGTLGNALVVFVVLRKRSMQTITNIFITNMAISDIIMSTLNVPLTPAAMFMDSWTLPSLVCKLMPMTMGVSVYVSSLTSTAIAIDRYFVIVHPFVPRMKTCLCLLIVFIVWLVAVLISTPIAVFQKIKVSDNGTKVSCIEDWQAEYRAVFTVISFVLQFLLPCAIITVCYSRVSVTLSNRYKNNTLANKSRTKEELDIRRKRRTNRMLIAMVAIFVICWIPLNLLWMVKDISFINENLFQGLFFICHVLAMSSVMYNPFLYGWMNNNFQKEFQSLMPACLRRAGGDGSSGGGGGGGGPGGGSRGNTTYRYSTVERSRQRVNGTVEIEDGIGEDEEAAGFIEEAPQQPPEQQPPEQQPPEQQQQGMKPNSKQRKPRQLVDED